MTQKIVWVFPSFFLLVSKTKKTWVLFFLHKCYQLIHKKKQKQLKVYVVSKTFKNQTKPWVLCLLRYWLIAFMQEKQCCFLFLALKQKKTTRENPKQNIFWVKTKQSSSQFCFFRFLVPCQFRYFEGTGPCTTFHH